jgi:hypothetical protein
LFQRSNPNTLFFRDSQERRLVESLDDFLNRLASRYTAIETVGTYWMFPLLIFPLRYTGTAILTGPAVIGSWPRFLPIESDVERKYTPKYHFVSGASIASVSDRCETGKRPLPGYEDRIGPIEYCETLFSPLGAKVLNVATSRLRIGDEAYIYPIGIDRTIDSDAIYSAAATDVTWRSPREPDALRDLSMGRVGIKDEIYRGNGFLIGWSILPVGMQAIRSALTPLAQPLQYANYNCYLLKIDGTFYHVYVLIFLRSHS